MRNLQEQLFPGSYLYAVGYARAVHSTGHVDRVAPDVVLRLPRADNPGHHRSDVQTCRWKTETRHCINEAAAAAAATPKHPNIWTRLTYLHLEVVEGMLVDVLHLLPQPHGVVRQRHNVRAALPVVGGVVETGRGHVGGADGLDLLQLPVLVFADDLRKTGSRRGLGFREQRPGRAARRASPQVFYLVKVSDDLVEQPETLHPLVVGLQLHVEFGEIADGGEHDGHALTGLVVQLVVAPLARQKVSRYVLGQNIMEEAAIVGLQFLHLLLLLCGLRGKDLYQLRSACMTAVIKMTASRSADVLMGDGRANTAPSSGR